MIIKLMKNKLLKIKKYKLLNAIIIKSLNNQFLKIQIKLRVIKII